MRVVNGSVTAPEEHLNEDRSHWSFGQLLAWHLARGTRPSGDRTKWKQETFAAEVEVSTNTLRDWIKKGVWPEQHRIKTMSALFFADAPELAGLRREFEDAFRRRASGMVKQPSLVRWLLRGPIAESVQKHSVEYDGARHELIRTSVEYRLAHTFTQLQFQGDHGPMLDHNDFVRMATPYIRDTVSRMDAFSRSTVTDWSRINALSNEYLESQRGKKIRRIFVLSNRAEYDACAASVFERHAGVYGAENILVASARLANTALKKLPEDLAPAPNTDFAIIDDAVVAFCTGPSEVCLRTDNLEGCRLLLNTVAAAVADQSYAALKEAPERIQNVFK